MARREEFTVEQWVLIAPLNNRICRFPSVFVIGKLRISQNPPFYLQNQSLVLLWRVKENGDLRGRRLEMCMAKKVRDVYGKG